jgi:hypothetical protein
MIAASTSLLMPGPASMRRLAAKLSAKLREAPPWHRPSRAALEAELKRFADRRGAPVRFWWRDDDAIAATPALDRLLAIQAEQDVPLCLAVIPAQATEGLAERLKAEPAVDVAQHGWDHHDHAATGEPPCELGGDRRPALVCAELRQGWSRLAELFGAKALPVLAPPFNRIGRGVTLAVMRDWRAISVAGDLPGIAAPTINVHLDLIDWTRHEPASESTVIAAALRALWVRRVGLVAPSAPIGIMTHHLVHTPAIWEATQRWVGFFRQSPEVRFAGLGGALSSSRPS